MFKKGFLEEEYERKSALLKSLQATEGEPEVGVGTLGGSLGGHGLCAVCGTSQPIWGAWGAWGAGTVPKKKKNERFVLALLS